MKVSNERMAATSKALIVASVAAVLAVGSSLAIAQHGGGGKSGSGQSDGHDSSSHDSGSKGGSKRGSGSSATHGRGGGGQSLRDVFRGMEEEAAADSHSTGKKGPPAVKGKSSSAAEPTTKGKRPAKDVAEDSDRPPYAGIPGSAGKPGRPNPTPSVKKGSIYGDMYIILRDASGLPILDANGYVQVMYYDSTGKLVCCIPRDAEGNLLPALPDGTAVLPIEVELARLSVGRSPTRVLSAQYEEALKSIAAAVSVELDAAGRIVLVAADGTKSTLDSPLVNLAIYRELLNTGTLAGIDASKLGSLSFLVDGVLTAEDLKVAASLFGAASDKTVTVTIDTVAYMNVILGIDGTLASNYVDYSTFTYNRETAYATATITVLVLQPDGSWKPTEVKVLDSVFKDAVPTGDLTNISAFTAATDDARAIIDYLHTYAVPTAE
ncbi:MAG: hypothetical protein R3D68_09175 [Hyphomicrobiaceae bacterium]